MITGGDSGIGRAVAIAYAREGADVVISYLSENDDAKDTALLVQQAGRRALLIPGDVSKAEHCRNIIAGRRQVRQDRHPGQQRRVSNEP